MTKEQRDAKNERDRQRRAEAKGPKGPKALKPVSAKKAKAAKVKVDGETPATTTSGSRKGIKELDVSKLGRDRAVKMLTKVHKLERLVEMKQRLFDLASTNRRSAQAELEEAQDALRKEIQDQRGGAGPLFDPNAEPLDLKGESAGEAAASSEVEESE